MFCLGCLSLSPATVFPCTPYLPCFTSILGYLMEMFACPVCLPFVSMHHCPFEFLIFLFSSSAFLPACLSSHSLLSPFPRSLHISPTPLLPFSLRYSLPCLPLQPVHCLSTPLSPCNCLLASAGCLLLVSPTRLACLTTSCIARSSEKESKDKNTGVCKEMC